MATEVQRRGGTTTEHSTFTGADREITIDTTKNTVVVHDGATAGGFPLATATNFKSTGIDDNSTYTVLTVADTGISMGDNDKISLGQGADLQIYHDGSNSYIQDAGDGDLILRGSSGIKMQSGSGVLEYLSTNSATGSIELKLSGATKLATTSTGIDVTGTVTADGLTVDGLTALKGTTQSDSVGIAQLENTTDNDLANASLTVKNRNGTSQFMQWQSFGTRIGSRVLANNGAGDLVLTRGADSEALRIDGSTGNLGIGTSSPSRKLHLGGTAPGDAVIRLDASVSGTNWEIGERAVAGKFQFRELDANKDVVTFLSSGNVGIGTTSPGSLLDVTRSDGAAYTASNTLVSGQWMRISNPNTAVGVASTLLFEIRGGGGGNGLATISGVQTGTGSTALTFGTRFANGSVTERMRIDSSGRVTMPNQPAFGARGYSGETSGDVQLWDTEEFDVGNNFDHNGTGRFTAPVSGRYNFSYFSGYKAADAYLGYELRVNGSQYFLNWSSQIATLRHALNGGSTVLNLNASDYVEVYIHPNTIYTSPDTATGYSMFSGYLIG